MGYHVVTLMYPDEIPASVCDNDNALDAFEDFRMAIIQGGNTKHISIGRHDSIENRFTKLLLFLKARRPKENWDQFLDDNGGIKWEAVAVGGLSQGGGHAALIGIKHRTARVVCAGSPKDFSKALDAPAAWYGKDSATPKACFFTFNHLQDPQGCTPKQLLRNLRALKLDPFGPPVDVTAEDYPYHHTRLLTSSYPAAKAPREGSEEAVAIHSSVIANKYADHWKQVWTYLLTEKAP